MPAHLADPSSAVELTTARLPSRQHSSLPGPMRAPAPNLITGRDRGCRHGPDHPREKMRVNADPLPPLCLQPHPIIAHPRPKKIDRLPSFRSVHQVPMRC
jgi:hypothetical protein